MDRSTQELCAFAIGEYCDGSNCGYMAARRCNQRPLVCQFEKKPLTRALALPGGATSTSARCLKSQYLFGFLRFLENLLAAVCAKQTVQQGRGCHSANTGGSSVREVRPRGQSGTSWLRCSKSENDRALWVCNVSAGSLPVHRHQARQGACWPGLEEARRDLRTSRPNSMRSQANLDEPYTSPKSPSARRPKSRQCSPPQKTRSPPATSRAANAAEAPVFPGQTTPPRQSWVGAH